MKECSKRSHVTILRIANSMFESYDNTRYAIVEDPGREIFQILRLDFSILIFDSG